MRSKRSWLVIGAVAAASLVVASLAIAASQGPKHHGPPFGSNSGNNSGRFATVLVGHNEVPAIHTNGMGKLTLTVNNDNTLSFELTYANLSSPAQVAHVHFGQPNVNGGVSFFFCGGAKPACPPGNTSTPATVTGTVAASDVLAIPAQGMPAGDLGAIVSEIKAGFAYANVHTTNFPGGEIRGQLAGNRGHFGFWDKRKD